jgi:hypothetical protein
MDNQEFNMTEEVVQFGSAGNLTGILGLPVSQNGSTPPCAAIILNAGLVHRVGPGRSSVRIARNFTGMGWLSLRFDHSSIGDSIPAASQKQSFEELAVVETRTAMDHLEASAGVERFVIVGLCSGAVTAFKSACVDPRIQGIVMINSRGFDASIKWNVHIQNQARARHYWRNALFSPRSWWRAVTGRIQYKHLLAVMSRQFRGNVKKPDEVRRVEEKLADELTALVQRKVLMLVINSEGDHSIDYIRAILGDHEKHLLDLGILNYEVISGADHTFSMLRDQHELIRLICSWAGPVGQARLQA